MRRPGPHEELTDPENERVLASLTPDTWRGLSAELVAALWFRLAPSESVGVKRASRVWHPARPWTEEEVTGLGHLLETESLLELLIHEARQSSGSIRGEHRRDLKEAIIGAPKVGAIGLSAQSSEPAAPSSTSAPKKERGL